MREHRPCRSGLLAASLVAASGFALILPAAAQDVQYVEPPKPEQHYRVSYYELPKGDHPHDVAPAPDGSVWYTGQGAGVLGRLDPKTGKHRARASGRGFRPARRDRRARRARPGSPTAASTRSCASIPRRSASSAGRCPRAARTPTSTPRLSMPRGAFGSPGRRASTGASIPRAGIWRCGTPRAGAGPTALPRRRRATSGSSRLPGSYLAKPDLETGAVTPIEPSRKGSGTRRVWSDSKGRLWVSEWNAGSLSVYDPQKKVWQTWPLPGEMPRAYAVFVDDEGQGLGVGFPGQRHCALRSRRRKTLLALPATASTPTCARCWGPVRGRRVWGAEFGHRPARRRPLWRGAQ